MDAKRCRCDEATLVTGLLLLHLSVVDVIVYCIAFLGALLLVCGGPLPVLYLQQQLDLATSELGECR